MLNLTQLQIDAFVRHVQELLRGKHIREGGVHVDRGKLFVQERFAGHHLLDVFMIEHESAADASVS